MFATVSPPAPRTTAAARAPAPDVSRAPSRCGPRPRGADVRGSRSGRPRTGLPGGRRRVRSRPGAVHCPERPVPRRSSGLRAGREEPLRDEHRVPHRRGPAAGPAGGAPIHPGRRRPDRRGGPRRRRRRRHRQDAGAGPELLRRLRGRGAARRWSTRSRARWCGATTCGAGPTGGSTSPGRPSRRSRGERSPRGLGAPRTDRRRQDHSCRRRPPRSPRRRVLRRAPRPSSRYRGSPCRRPLHRHVDGGTTAESPER